MTDALGIDALQWATSISWLAHQLTKFYYKFKINGNGESLENI